VQFRIDEGLRAEGDQKLVAALLRHLIKRAASACKAELQPMVPVGSGSREGQAVFYVSDNGPGMDAATQEKLFRPVEPGSTMENTVDIGIVSARRAVERHGGELILESARGKGTTFFFSLPAG
jgi:chemotaxis family two-component system sensor kinase Cph1